MRISGSVRMFIAIAMVLRAAVGHAEAQSISPESSRAVVSVVAYDDKGGTMNHGSGFIVSSDGVVVTNYHVIGNAHHLKIRLGGDTFDVKKIFYVDSKNDIAVVKADGMSFPAVRLGDSDHVAEGEDVFVVWNPEGLMTAVAGGIVTKTREVMPRQNVLQITVPVAAGLSGGPVFNRNGEVIGIATHGMEGREGPDFAIPINLIKDKLVMFGMRPNTKSAPEHVKTDAGSWFALGNTHMREGRFKEAEDAYRTAINLQPDYAEAYSALGLAYGTAERPQEATDACRTAIKLKPDSAAAYSCLGMASAMEGRFQEAVDAYTSAVRLKTDDPYVYYNLGSSQSKVGRFQDAADAYRTAAKLKPDFAMAYFNLGNAYSKLGRHEDAVDAFRRAAKLKPDFAMAYFNLGNAYSKLRRHEKAVDAFRTAIKLKPDFTMAYFNLGIVYLSVGDKGAALEQHKLLMNIDPQQGNKLFHIINKKS